MDFVGKKCYLCGKKFGGRKPEDATGVDPFTFEDRRIVSVVAPCPFCGEKIPVWAGTDPIVTEPETSPGGKPGEKPEEDQ